MGKWLGLIPDYRTKEPRGMLDFLGGYIGLG